CVPFKGTESSNLSLSAKKQGAPFRVLLVFLSAVQRDLKGGIENAPASLMRRAQLDISGALWV
ncbi:MAG TPA: hypothetical protein PKB13_12075, partial [Clostridia bacterium]|nr:hypothetical protein [Clostridia bacterium]